MSDLLAAMKTAIASGLTSQTLDLCSRWAMYRRVMGAPFPGKFGFKYHPWCRELHDSRANYNTAMKAAQLGITEVAINRAFYTIDVLKKDVLYVLPTAINAGDFAKARFNTALLHSDYLKQLFTATNTIGLKQAGGVNLYIRGSRGDSNLKSIPVSTLILDEVDEMDQRAIWLALERLSGYTEKAVWAISTPTVPKFGIHKLYLQGTQEHYHFICPRCGKWTELTYPDCIEITGESITDPKLTESFLQCKECKGQLDHETKPEWLKDGKWIPTADCLDDHRSFYLNQLYSYTISPREVALGFFRGHGDEAATVEFHNSKLGIPYIPDGGQVTDDEIDSCVRSHTKQAERPTTGGERFLVMGVDQGKINYAVIMEFFFDKYGYDLNAAAFGKLVWEGKLPGTDWTELDRMMREWQILHCVVDADPNINDARRFARRFPGYVTLCRYRRGVSGKEIQLSEEDGGAPVATVDRTGWLDASLGRFHSARIALPADISLEFRDHVKALCRTYERDEQGNPRATYLTVGADHLAHALNYAEIALPLAASVVSGRNIEKML